MLGKISFYDAVRHFGFIVRDSGGPDIFVHGKHVLNGNGDLLKKDQRVSFEIVHDDLRGKLRADSVKILDEDMARAWPEDRKNARN